MRLGDSKLEDSSSVSGSLHCAWINRKGAVSAQDAHAILAECEYGKHSAVKEYKKAMEEIWHRRCVKLCPVNMTKQKARTIESATCAIRARLRKAKVIFRKRMKQAECSTYSVCCLDDGVFSLPRRQPV